MKPLLKWAGGKRQIAEELFSCFPEDWGSHTFIEPFIGGGAMFLHLNPKKAIIADLNKRLVNFYIHIKNSPDEVEAGVLDLAKRFDAEPDGEKKKFFLDLRSSFNHSDTESLQSAIHLYALNKLCFNGLYRENSKGFFNVPFGQKKKFPELEIGVFRNASDLLQKAEILNADFETTIAKAEEGDFIYLDPPYIPLDMTSNFTSYQAGGFGLADQKRLSKAMLELKENGIKAMCSNSDTPLTRDVFNSLNLKTIQAPRMVSAKASGRGMISELVITNY
jgi:DNA adenine methylase